MKCERCLSDILEGMAECPVCGWRNDQAQNPLEGGGRPPRSQSQKDRPFMVWDQDHGHWFARPWFGSYSWTREEYEVNRTTAPIIMVLFFIGIALVFWLIGLWVLGVVVATIIFLSLIWIRKRNMEEGRKRAIELYGEDPNDKY